MIELPPASPEVEAWMRTWAERNPEKAERFAKNRRYARDRYGRFAKVS